MIKKIEQLLKTGFFHIFGSSVLNKILTFFSNIIVVRIISKVDFGVYTYSLNILSFVMLLSGMGLVLGTFQLCSEHINDKGKQQSIFEYGCSIGIRFNCILTIIIILIGIFLELPIKDANELLILMCLQPIFLIIYEFQQIFLRSNLENKKYSYATTLNTLLIVIFSVLGALTVGVKGLIFGRYIAYSLTIISIIILFKSVPCFKSKGLMADEKKALYNMSMISMFNNGISELLYLIDVFLLGLILSSEEMIASYKVATVIPTACIFIPMAVVTYIYPYFASHKDDKEWTRKNYKLLLKYVALANFAISLLMIILAEPIITVIYGTQYLDATVCFRILAVNYFFSGTFRIISGNLLATQRKFRFNLYLNLGCGTVNIIGNLLLIPSLHSVGAALTTLTVVIISSVFSTIYYIRTIR